MSVLAVLEQRAGSWNRVSFEALTAAGELARLWNAPVYATVPGDGIGALTSQAAAFPISKVFAIDDPLLRAYTPEAFTTAFEQLIRALQPKAVVFPHTYQVRDYAPRLAARFSTALMSDVIAVKAGSDGPVYVRQMFQGKLNADVRPVSGIAFASVQAGAFQPAHPESTRKEVESFSVSLEPGSIRSKPEEPFRGEQRTVDLSGAERIVAVGRGIREKENLGMVEELASVLGAELAASRPICDNGWLPMERQVGSSGQTVSPKLYVAVGISGAIQHLVGMKGSKTIVAINKDESAPIFESADYGIVGDLFEVVPALVAEIRKVKT
jgi:electron transfer flavoprotein alpha subunit